MKNPKEHKNKMIYTEQQIFDKHNDCVLKIVSFGSDGQYLSHGSAVVLKSEKMVITNFHNIMNADNFELYTEGGELVNYTGMVANDPEKDILILSIDSKVAKKFSDLKYDYQSNNKIGDKIVSISFQENYEKIISEGIIGGINKAIKCDFLKFGRQRKNLVIFTASISPGSSGGAVFNLKGELIGVSTLTDNRGQNLNFAIPLKEIIELIIEAKSNTVFKKNTYKVKEYVYKVFRAIENKDYEIAIENLNLCLELEICELYFLQTKVSCLCIKGDFEIAIENCNYGISKFPSEKEEFDRVKIAILIEQKKYLNAFNLIQPYILINKTKTKDTDFVLMWAETCLELGRFEEAYEVLEKARIEKTDDGLIYSLLSRYYYESNKNIYKAVRILYEGLTFFPEEVRIYSYLYFIYYSYSTLINSSQSKLIKALEFINKAIFLMETQDELYLYRRYYVNLIYEKANLLNVLGEYEEALDVVNYYIDFYPDKENGYSLRGSIKYSQKKYEESLKDFDYALKINDKDENSYAGKALIYSDLDDEKNARVNLEKLIELQPVDISFKVAIVIVYNKFKDYENALLYCNNILLQNEKHYSTLFTIANIYANTGKYEEAKKSYGIIYKYYPNDKNLYFCWGTFLVIFCKLYEDAIKVLSIAINKFNDYYKAYLYRGIAQFELLRYEMAIQDFNKALEILPNSEDVYLCRGKAYYSLSKVNSNPKIVEMAIKDFNKTIEISPSYEDAYYFRGISFYFLGLYEKALLDWEYLIGLNINMGEKLTPLIKLALKNINPNIFRKIINFFKKTR